METQHDLNEMAIFTRVTQSGSFTSAARSLGIPKSTVSRKVAQLEKRLGVRLLHRTTRKLRATEIGKAYAERCARILAEIQEAESAVSSMQQAPQGTLRITATAEFGVQRLQPILNEYLARYPLVRVETLLSGRVVDLVDEGVDVAIRLGPLEDSSLSARKIGTGTMRMYASPAYLKRKGTPRSPDELPRHDFVHFTGPFPEPEIELQDSSGRTLKIPITGRIMTNNLSFAVQAAVDGHGIALIPPYLCEEQVESKKLREVLAGWTTAEDPIHLVFPSQRYLTPKVRAFIDCFTEAISRCPAVTGLRPSQPSRR